MPALAARAGTGNPILFRIAMIAIYDKNQMVPGKKSWLMADGKLMVNGVPGNIGDRQKTKRANSCERY